MRPGNPVGELLQKGGSGDHLALTSTHILDVSDVRFDLPGLHLIERQLPKFLPDLLTCTDYLINQLLIRSDDGGVHIA